jgi:L-aspartate oxidase
MNGLFDQRRYLIPFRSTLLPQIFTDTLVIGGGVGGARAAVEAAGGGDVILLSKSAFNRTNTSWAQGGIAAVLGSGEGGDGADSFESHVRDTLVAGAGLCDEPVVRAIVTDGAERVRELIDWGCTFDADADGTLQRGREGGHAHSRIYHAGGDATGREIQGSLTDRVRATPGVRVFENCFALDLITPSDEPGSPVLGAVTYHRKHGLQMIWARTTILASGGAGQLYRETSNPAEATADGIAMAYRAGATVSDTAFVQFHPTTLYLPGANRRLITEAVRGEGAYLVDDAGLRFMTEAHELAELAPRDIVTRGIVRRIAAHGGTHVWLDCRHLSGFATRFPGIHRLLGKFGLDASRDLIPVHPAAHYMVGGVRTDEHGRTDVPGLLAVGEVAVSGLHGANRLASNSLLEGLVVGQRAGAIAGEAAREARGADGGTEGSETPRPVSIVSDIRPSPHAELDLTDVRSSLRSAMWRNVGIERTGSRLEDVVDMLDFWGRYTLDKIFDEPEGWETQNMLLAGAIVARSAAWRTETRGCHTRTDCAEPDPDLLVHDGWRRGCDEPEVTPVATSDAGAAV